MCLIYIYIIYMYMTPKILKFPILYSARCMSKGCSFTIPCSTSMSAGVEWGLQLVSIFMMLCIDSALLFVQVFAELPRFLKFKVNFGVRVLAKYLQNCSLLPSIVVIMLHLSSNWYSSLDFSILLSPNMCSTMLTLSFVFTPILFF